MVTLYGFSAGIVHDRFTGFKGSFEKTLENLEEVTKRYPKLRTFITITVLAHNYHEIFEICAGRPSSSINPGQYRMPWPQ